MSRELSPGEIYVSPVSIGGHRYYEQKLDDGSVERGTVVPTGHPCAEHSQGFVSTSEHRGGGVYRVKESIRYTPKWAVSSDAYRSGWDATFGRAREEPCKPS